MVQRCGSLQGRALENLLLRYGIQLRQVAAGDQIPGTYWGEPEAGIIGDCLHVRGDTPVHSALHEASHVICMTPHRRAGLLGNAGGDYAEENGVCFLQVILADFIPGMGRARMLEDMDAWGYSFRLGSAAAWFDQDAEDARDWLRSRYLIDEADRPTWRLRGPEVEEPAYCNGALSA